MGPYRAAALIALALNGTLPVAGQQPGWHYSPLPGEGDRASMGCARGSNLEGFTCLAVRCEPDFTTGIHVYSSRPQGDRGSWEMTLDRETRTLSTTPDETPYGARLDDVDGWLLDGLRHGTFVYLRHSDDMEGAFAFIDLSGSFRSIAEALQWCAPRVPRSDKAGAEPASNNGDIQ